MSFTRDELQSLNDILDKKMLELQDKLEQSFEQRMQVLRNEFEQHQQRLEESIERSFVAQLLAFEQLINQRFPVSNSPISGGYTDQPPTSFEAIEVQTEIPWEDLIDLLNKALNERFITFNASLQTRLRDLEHDVSSQIQLLREDLRREQPMPSSPTTYGTDTEMQDMVASINQLERIVESMQVAMAANSTLISNRLSHHQRLPMERAHPSHPSSFNEHEHTLEKERNLSSFSPGETKN
jgi:hypothetical protein